VCVSHLPVVSFARRLVGMVPAIDFGRAYQRFRNAATDIFRATWRSKSDCFISCEGVSRAPQSSRERPEA